MRETVAGYPWGTFWTAAGVFVALGVGIGALVVPRVMGSKRRRLTYFMEADALLGSHSNLAGSLQVTLRSPSGPTPPLTNPHVVRLRLANAGRDDINSGDFEGGRPIKLDIKVPILGFLDTSSTPKTGAAPPHSYQGSVLKVGPGLIAKRQTVTYVLLTDEKPTLGIQHELRSTDVKEGSPSVPWEREMMNHYRMVAIWFALALVSYVAVDTFTGKG